VARGERIAKADDDGQVAIRALRLRLAAAMERSGQTERKKKQQSVSSRHIDIVARGSEPGMIEVRGLKKSIRNGSRTVEILKGIDLSVPQGQFLAIMGASGSGKSTLLGLLAGLDAPSEGQVLVDGTDISRLAEDKLAQVRGKKIGFVFQSYQLIPTLTAFENVLLPYELNANGDGKKHAAALLETVGLADRLHHYPVQLSGGEQQRVALARAFVLEPPIVLADEPTGNLDSSNGQHVLDLLTERQREANTTLVLVTHDRQIADRADRCIFLRDGRIVSDESGKQASYGD